MPTLASANRSPTWHHTRCLPSALYSENRDSSVKRTPRQSVRCHRMWAFAHSSRLRRRTAVRSRPRWGQRACRWASLRQFVQKLFGYANRLLQQLSAYGREININSRATALVDIPAVSMPFARSLKLKTCICSIVLCDITHYIVAFYCGQLKAHLCNNHAV